MRDEQSRDCEFTDGLYQNGHPECEMCFFKIRAACRVFSIYNGLREPEYYIPNEKPDVKVKETEQMSLAERIKRARKEW